MGPIFVKWRHSPLKQAHIFVKPKIGKHVLDSFWTLRIKKETAVRFRAFARMYYSTQSLALDGMLDFFNYNEISPHEKLGPRMTLIMDFLKHLKQYLGNRNNATIAIIREIEKEGVLPTKAMIQLLFEQAPPQGEQPELIEIAHGEVGEEDDHYNSLQAIEHRKEKNIIKRELEETRKKFDDILFSKIKETRHNFGKPRLYLDITPEEFESLRETFKNK